MMESLTNMINISQPIPLEIVMTSKTNWVQFGATFTLSLIGSVFILYFLWTSYSDTIKSQILKISLKNMRKKTKRGILIIKHTNQSLFGGSMIDQETLHKIMTALHKFNGKDFDLILHTPGGEIFPALFISRLLRNYKGKIRVFISGYAMSGGTLLALSCDEIYMSPVSCLGPVDAQLGTLFKFGSAKSWDKILKFKGKKAEDSSISLAYTGKQYTKTIYDHTYSLLENKMEDVSKRKAFTKFITSGGVEHAFALTPDELKNFGLNIKTIPIEFQNKLIKIISGSSLEGVYYIK